MRGLASCFTTGVGMVEEQVFASRCHILAYFWVQHEDNPWDIEDRGLSSFVADNEFGLSLAFILAVPLAEGPSDEAVRLINDTYRRFCGFLGIDPRRTFDNVEEALSSASRLSAPGRRGSRPRDQAPTRSPDQYGIVGYFDGAPPSKPPRGSRSRPQQSTVGAARTLPQSVKAGIGGVGVAVLVALVLTFTQQGTFTESVPGEPSDPRLELDNDPAGGTGGNGNGIAPNQPRNSTDIGTGIPNGVDAPSVNGVDPPGEDERPLAGKGSGCKIGVADGDRCVGVRPVPGPRGPVPQPFSIPRESTTPDSPSSAENWQQVLPDVEVGDGSVELSPDGTDGGGAVEGDTSNRVSGGWDGGDEMAGQS